MKGLEDCSSKLAIGCGVISPVPVPVPQMVHTNSVYNNSKTRRSEGFNQTCGGRSYSASLGKIGRIDEEKPCFFVGELKFDGFDPKSTTNILRSHIHHRTTYVR
ncbi:hypothetical protein ACFE04_001166 [Oxalis oulophora]